MAINIVVSQTILDSIEKARIKAGRAIVAIDGRGGAGKSSVARAIVAKIPDSTHVEYDWFHLPQKSVTPMNRFDNERLAHDVLNPFSAGQKTVTFKRYNWGYLAGTEDGLDPSPFELQFGSVIVLEGCSTLNPTLDKFYDVRIWIDTSPEESLRRGVKRDIDEYKLEPNRVHAAWDEWAIWEAQDSTLDERRRRAQHFI